MHQHEWLLAIGIFVSLLLLLLLLLLCLFHLLLRRRRRRRRRRCCCVSFFVFVSRCLPTNLSFCSPLQRFNLTLLLRSMSLTTLHSINSSTLQPFIRPQCIFLVSLSRLPSIVPTLHHHAALSVHLAIPTSLQLYVKSSIRSFIRVGVAVVASL